MGVLVVLVPTGFLAAVAARVAYTGGPARARRPAPLTAPAMSAARLAAAVPRTGDAGGAHVGRAEAPAGAALTAPFSRRPCMW
ncbi:hypothetical protein [Marinitenerispora sediminis]|uniref:Uncharacterized protein n=2 Tax=Marinitenerispora sediminis TaxID=1931232 RepID=A0A368T841_9ACTN|nr:hypothetical protein [Marinitenerispora sediminis]RCV51082.1 hypothetical protein DEF28_16305 [Marinitenerispora sediminis]RCV56579.1 hypothetical protein DEF23_12340 [Marinitenerispora sediminis]RCV60077.1 hypothetical protein DEF24_07960 [Marinitenerispora sediminis]